MSLSTVFCPVVSSHRVSCVFLFPACSLSLLLTPAPRPAPPLRCQVPSSRSGPCPWSSLDPSSSVTMSSVALIICYINIFYFSKYQTSIPRLPIGPTSSPPSRRSIPPPNPPLLRPAALRTVAPPPGIMTCWPTISFTVWASLTLTSSLGLRPPPRPPLLTCTSSATTHLNTYATWVQRAALRCTPPPHLPLPPYLPPPATLHLAPARGRAHIRSHLLQPVCQAPPPRCTPSKQISDSFSLS